MDTEPTLPSQEENAIPTAAAGEPANAPLDDAEEVEVPAFPAMRVFPGTPLGIGRESPPDLNMDEASLLNYMDGEFNLIACLPECYHPDILFHLFQKFEYFSRVEPTEEAYLRAKNLLHLMTFDLFQTNQPTQEVVQQIFKKFYDTLIDDEECVQFALNMQDTTLLKKLIVRGCNVQALPDLPWNEICWNNCLKAMPI